MRPPSSRFKPAPGPFIRVNGKIRAREVRVIGDDGSQLGVMALTDALTQARSKNIDLVEIAPNATPPVCRLVDYGKYRYELSKREKESHRHQHANKVKEIQLSPNIDTHDFGVKLSHAIDFLSDEMKVKITLKFRGREMAHQEYGFQAVNKFIAELQPYAHADAPPKLIGRGINVMLSPLPRNKRAKHPRQLQADDTPSAKADSSPDTFSSENENSNRLPTESESERPSSAPPHSDGFVNNPFNDLKDTLGPE